MKTTVGVTEVELDTSPYADLQGEGQVLIIQNLGVGDLYFDFLTGVTVGTGVKVAANGGYEVPGWRPNMSIFLIASAADTDVRFTVAG